MGKSLRASAATVVLLGLPVAQFIRDGTVSETLIGALLIMVFGSGGFAADKALKARVREWTKDEESDDDA